MEIKKYKIDKPLENNKINYYLFKNKEIDYDEDFFDKLEYENLELGQLPYLAILGFDIYRYSELPEKGKFLITKFLEFLHKLVLQTHKYRYGGSFNAEDIVSYISTGDGAYIAFKKPEFALFYAFALHTFITHFNRKVYFQPLNEYLKKYLMILVI
jgi:hypothetical protein